MGPEAWKIIHTPTKERSSGTTKERHTVKHGRATMHLTMRRFGKISHDIGGSVCRQPPNSRMSSGRPLASKRLRLQRASVDPAPVFDAAVMAIGEKSERPENRAMDATDAKSRVQSPRPG